MGSKLDKYLRAFTTPVYLDLNREKIPEGFEVEGPDHPCLHFRHLSWDEVMSFDGNPTESAAAALVHHTGDLRLAHCDWFPDLEPGASRGGVELKEYRKAMAIWIGNGLSAVALKAMARRLAAANRLSDAEGNG